MTTPFRKWEFYPPLPPSAPAFPLPHPLVAQILYNRGLRDAATVKDFLAGRVHADDPFDLLGMQRAVKRIRQAIEAGERIAVYGDFDADGVTATALLLTVLRALRATADPYIPHRVEEGYGLNLQALEKLAQQGVKLVITVDCGMRSPREVAFARQQGMDIIITDHHTVGNDHLDAAAIINPQQEGCRYPYKHLAGVGLAYKLAQALLQTNRTAPFAPSPSLHEDDLLDLVALGTVADLAPLTGENRALVRRGLERLNSDPRPGIEALIRQARLRAGQIDSTAIGFALGPRLNAAGRMAHAHSACDLLLTNYPAEANHLAQELDRMNRERQQLTAEMEERAVQMIRAEGEEQPLLFVAGPEFPAGVVGLVASRLVETFYRPAVVVEQGNDESHGSARSVPEFHITAAFDQCAELLIRHGGHAAAGGFAALTADLPRIKQRLLDIAAEQLEGCELVPRLTIDARVPLQEMSWALWEALQPLQPFGEANPEPLFASRNVQVRDSRPVGSEGKHLKLTLFDGKAVWDAIAFGQGHWAGRLPGRIDIAYNLQVNEWQGEKRLQLNVQDIRPAGEKEPSCAS